MNKTKTLMIPLALVFLSWAAESPVINLKLSELRIQTEKVKKDIQEEEKSWAEEQSRETEAEKKRKERYEAYTQERIEMQKSLETLDQQIQERMDQVEEIKTRSSNMDGQVLFLRSVILSECRGYADLVANGFPYRAEKRTESIQLLIDDLAKDRISPEEGFNRLWVLYQAEQTAASEGEIYSGQMDAGNGQTFAVKYMRVGKQALAYMSPAGDRLGILIKGKDGKWDWMRENAMDLDMRTRVRNAIAVAEGKAVPGFVPFPFWFNAEERK
ncbi:MAG TPA: DUF3450 family protein [Fibrobacteraceae bacterium]|nr:DUF3450 family protein [Fibrobacteraceae bacterium]